MPAQTSLPALVRNSGYCGKRLCPKNGKAKATHLVTLTDRITHEETKVELCRECSRPYEGLRGAVVMKIQEERS